MRNQLTQTPAARAACITAGLALLGVVGCRGEKATEPPIHLQRNMFTQDKGKPQRENPFFADHRTQRPPVEGTVAVSAADPTSPVQTGRDADGALVKKSPVPVTMDLMRRGQERFNIYCAPCHSKSGGTPGIVVIRAAGSVVKPPPYWDERLRKEPDGHFFDVITNGKNSMPSYAHQIPVDDRWAIVAYVRALQRTHAATPDDVPPEQRSNLP